MLIRGTIGLERPPSEGKHAMMDQMMGGGMMWGRGPGGRRTDIAKGQEWLQPRHPRPPPLRGYSLFSSARQRLLAVSMETSRYTERSSASLLRVTSRPALRKPVMAARTVCGSQPSRCPICATVAPSGRSSRPISCARLVLAGGCSAPLALGAFKSTCSVPGVEPERAGSGLSCTTRLPLRLAFGIAAAFAAARSVRAAPDCDSARRLPRWGSCSLLATAFLVVPVSTFGSGLVFACLLVCLAMASLSNSAPRLSRCLHHHEPGARRPGGAATSRRPSTHTAMLALAEKSSGIGAGQRLFDCA